MRLIRNASGFVLLFLMTAQMGKAQKVNVKKAFEHAEKQTDLMLSELVSKTNANLVSPRTLEKERLNWLLPKIGPVVFFLVFYGICMGMTIWRKEKKKQKNIPLVSKKKKTMVQPMIWVLKYTAA